MMIKKTIFMASAILLLSNTATATSNKTKHYSLYNVGQYTLMRDCGMFDSSFSNSVFGNPKEYMKNYSQMGRFLSEIEQVKKISNKTKSYARRVMSKAKANRYAALDMGQDIEIFFKRNERFIGKSNALHENTVAKYKEQKKQLHKEANYVSEKSIKDIKQYMSKEEYVENNIYITDFMIWSACKEFWNQ